MNKNSHILSSVELQVEKAREDNIRLQGELAWVKSPEFAEREARDKLGMGREGEVILILPRENETSTNPQTPNPDLGVADEKPNWRKWWELYIKI